ncbi:cation diffusion facilitator family transporter [Rheinheimera sp. 4Y26]|uniref:cation diffusion facilitator family transporter n=1 Tax=Rheinheimera sp. 4Y26 TaxID=2977811 RepID=UPI0021B0F5BB|nr:cation diffusion facilitator family transporter [Rheinheimera sp. 4Y26]MCT6700668.1 cation diffusion facilitator family transporter [Rheinheimera sp. 4Y26]
MPHDHHHHYHSSESNNIATAFWLNFSFTLIEFIGGFLTNSVAIMADAMHDLGDCLAIGFAWVASRVAKREANLRYSYGYRRWSLLSALVNSVILVLGSLWILSEAIPRLWQPEQPMAEGMIVLAVLGVLVNGAAVYKLRFGKTQNEQVLSWHLLEDVLGWVAVLVGSIVLYLTSWAWIDPVLSIGFTCFILLNVWRNLRKTLQLFLQVSPNPALAGELAEKLTALPFVADCHHLHLWSLDGEQHVLTVHLVLKAQADGRELPYYKTEVRQLLLPYQLAHTTVEFETADEACRDNKNATASLHDHDHDHGNCSHAGQQHRH